MPVVVVHVAPDGLAEPSGLGEQWTAVLGQVDHGDRTLSQGRSCAFRVRRAPQLGKVEVDREAFAVEGHQVEVLLGGALHAFGDDLEAVDRQAAEDRGRCRVRADQRPQRDVGAEERQVERLPRGRPAQGLRRAPGRRRCCGRLSGNRSSRTKVFQDEGPETSTRGFTVDPPSRWRRLAFVHGLSVSEVSQCMWAGTVARAAIGEEGGEGEGVEAPG